MYTVDFIIVVLVESFRHYIVTVFDSIIHHSDKYYISHINLEIFENNSIVIKLLVLFRS